MNEQGWQSKGDSLERCFSACKHEFFWQSGWIHRRTQNSLSTQKLNSWSTERKKTQLKFGQHSATFARIEVRGPALDLAAVTPPFTTKPCCSALPDHHVQQGTWDLELRAMCWGSQETWTDTVTLGLLPGVSPNFTFAVGIRKGTERKPQTFWKRTVFHSEEEGWTP